MKKEKDYTKDIAEIRSMMERSSKFLSLAGWAGILAGVYALAGAYIAHTWLHFAPDEVTDSHVKAEGFAALTPVILLAVVILVLAIGTAVWLSNRKAARRGEKLWNASGRLLVINMAVPLFTGGLLIILLIAEGMTGLLMPFTLIFYGLALYNAGKYTYSEVKVLGVIQICIGLIAAYFVAYGIYFWAFGFGLVHIIYGIYMYYSYER